MKITPTLCIALAIILSVQCNANAQPLDKQFSSAELQEDFKAFRNKYESMLANLYLYTPKQQLDKVFDSLYQNIQPMTTKEFYSYITPVSSFIKDGHANIYLPEDVTEYNSEHADYFPFNVYWFHDSLYISMNLSEDTTLKEGTVILDINGNSAKEIMDYLLARQVRDGNNNQYPIWILNTYFRAYYGFHFGYPKTYTLTIKSGNNPPETKQLKALPRALIAQHKTARYPAQKKESYFYMDTANHTGIFTLKDWEEKGLKGRIDEVFAQLKSLKAANLIIDVRDNQGGDFNPAIQLLSNLLKEPFEYFSDLKSVAGMSDSGLILKTQTGKILGTQKPVKNPYTGKLYVLINGGCFSNTASFCSRIEYYKRGIFIGEETGGNKVVFSGVFGLKEKTVLPNTKIICENANYRMTVSDITKNTGHGIIPTHLVVPTINDILTNKDVVMEYALKLISKDK